MLAEHLERDDVEVALPRAAALVDDRQGEVFGVGEGGEGGDEHAGVAVADEEDVGAGAVHEGAVGGGLAVAVRQRRVVGLDGLPVEAGGDGGEAGGGEVLAGDGGGAGGGVGDGGDDDDGGDDAGGEADGDDGAAVAVEEGRDPDGVFEDLVAERGEGGGDEDRQGDGGEGAGSKVRVMTKMTGQCHR